MKVGGLFLGQKMPVVTTKDRLKNAYIPSKYTVHMNKIILRKQHVLALIIMKILSYHLNYR